MPVVAINFIRKTLERNLGTPLDIELLFDFLDDIINRASQQQALLAFKNKWIDRLHRNSKKMMIVGYNGMWAPPCLSRKELKNQPTWQLFARRYVPGFVECTVNSQSSPDYQPQNFTELVQLTFWKEMYETFGYRIIDHIFQKCSLLFEVEEGLYLLVAYSQGVICRKLTQSEKSKQFGTNESSAHSGPIQSNPYKLTEVATQSAMPRVRQLNHTGVSAVCGARNNDTEKENSNPTPRETNPSRPASGLRSRSPSCKEPCPKRRKLDPTTAVSGEVRWITPNSSMLDKVIQHRKAICLHNGITTSLTTMPPSGSSSELNFISIQKDNNFEAGNKLFVLKQDCKIPVKRPRIPPTWKGLKLPDLSKNTGETVLVNVFKISETLAKSLGIRIKPKKRCKKKTRRKQFNDGNLHKPNREGRKVLRRVVKKTIPQRPAPTDLSQWTIPTFQPDVLLPIISCLYNRTARTEWPKLHSLSTAAAKVNVPKEAIEIVLNDILQARTCSSAVHTRLLEVVSRNKALLEGRELVTRELLKVIQRHKRYKKSHKLLKSCLSYWSGKLFEKQQKKRSRVKVKERSNGVEVPGDQPLAPRREIEPEVIDLTSDTSGACLTKSSTNFSQTTGETHETLSSENVVFLKTPSPPLLPPPAHVLNSSTIKSISNAKSPVGKCPHRRSSSSKLKLSKRLSGNSAKKLCNSRLSRIVPYNALMQTLKQIFHIMHLDRLLGSKRNIRGFFRFVRKSIVLGGTRSSLHLGQLMALLHPEDTPFAKIHDLPAGALESFTAKLAHWLFNDYVLTLLRTSFYITECNFSRSQLIFYLKESWISAAHKMRSNLLLKKALRELRQDDNSSSGLQPRINAVLRFMPKQNHSLRSLLLMKKTALGMNAKELSNLKLLLHYIDAKVNHTRMYIPSCIQYAWRIFLKEWRSKGSPKLYFLRTDIRDAYPSVSPTKLSEILHSSCETEVGSPTTFKLFLVLGTGHKKFFRRSVFNSECRTNWHSGIHVRPCVVLDLERNETCNVQGLLDKISSLIVKPSTVRIGRKVYEFSFGLPQGWGPSPILCSIYYGHLDSSLYIPFANMKDRLIVRIVDDYLFITPKPQEILSTVGNMRTNCEKHNIKLNEDKFESNIFIRSDVSVPQTICDKVTFCGWNFCLTCGHVARDYKKYYGQDFCSTVTFGFPKNLRSPEQFIHLRGTLIMPARLKPILIDRTINCERRILLTVFEASILLGFRFYAICRVVYPNLHALREKFRAISLMMSITLCCQRLTNHVIRNSQCLETAGPLSTYHEEVSCFVNCCGNENTVQERTTTQPSPSPNNELANLTETDSPKFDFSYNTLLFISYLGFRLKLQKHSEVFKQVLPRMDYRISELRSKIGSQKCDYLVKIVGNVMPKYFHDIPI